MTEDLLRISIAEEIMGIEVYQATLEGYEKLQSYDDRNPKYDLYHWIESQIIPIELPQYTRNLRNAWEVIEKMKSHFRWAIFELKLSESAFWMLPECDAATKICLLALGVIRGY